MFLNEHGHVIRLMLPVIQSLIQSNSYSRISSLLTKRSKKSRELFFRKTDECKIKHGGLVNSPMEVTGGDKSQKSSAINFERKSISLTSSAKTKPQANDNTTGCLTNKVKNVTSEKSQLNNSSQSAKTVKTKITWP